MDDPIKIIFKYKNNNRRTQHHLYIFVGNVAPKIMSILNSIKDKSLYDSLISLDKSDYTKLEKQYGTFWYKKFFNTYHILHTINNIRNNKSQQKELTDKYGKDWFKNHIEEHKLIDEKVYYNYASVVKDEMVRKEIRKRKIKIKEEDHEIDYTTIGKRRAFSDSYLGRLEGLDDKLTEDEAFAEVEKRSEPVEDLTSDIEDLEKLMKLDTSVDASDVNDSLDSTDFINSEDLRTTDEEEIYKKYMTGGSIDTNKYWDADDVVHLIQEHVGKQNGGFDDNSSDMFDDDIIREFNEDDNDDNDEAGTVEGDEYSDKQIGGQDDDEDPYENDDNYSPNKTGDEDGDGVVEYDEGVDTDVVLEDEEEVDFEEMEKIYQGMDVQLDENAEKTTKLIIDALKDEGMFKKASLKLVEFDRSKDDLMYDEKLKDVYIKNYITNQYIFKDDTVKTIKNKICCSIWNNAKFSKQPYLAPSRQYLWSEYIFDDKLDKVMIGQKWIRRTDLLKIDVEPNENIRFYEELRGKLKLLKENIKRYGSKIKREDDDFNILYDYERYYTNNEIFMLDVYNELGKGYNPDQESLRNISDVYIRIYFPRIKQEDVKYIVDYLNGNTKVENSKTSLIYENINNDLLMENQVMGTVEEVKLTPVYKDLFKDNYITQSVIHVNLRMTKDSKLDLYRIFDRFETTDKYPFIQYQTIDGQIIFKFNEKEITEYSSKKDNVNVLSKWFENAPYGISFKVKITEKGEEKFMAINLNETGRIEYKTQWKEEDMATIEDIKNTYTYVKDLIAKLNKEKNKVEFEIPDESEFKYAFINTIQKFVLPEDFMIDHNDLSEFSRFFYPYVALVIEPRKRQAKVKKEEEKSKFGTYLRYKRVSKYENQARIEQRVLYFMRNYDYNDKSLANEISKQFNITIDRAMDEIERVRGKYPNIKRSRKILKKLENIPKYKPPGIGIDIQGKQRDKYKIRISGARNKEQLDRIITFMNILIYLYVETYLYKRPERQALKETLKKLVTIARRRNRVDEIVNYEKTTKTVKQITALDKKRIGFKPEKGQNQWTRSCQNSGNDKKRRPAAYSSPEDLLAQGFKLDTKTGIFEKDVTYTTKSKKKKTVKIRAAGLKSIDEEGNEIGTVYYTCNPQENGDHMYVGFLSRSNNPSGLCMPCCFKKDPVISKNKEKKEYFMKCIGKTEEAEKKTTKIIGDRLYILQDTNKIQEGRFGFLPKYLDFFFNRALGKDRRIKHHYLMSSKSGYYFKYGTRQDEYPFLNAIASLLDMNITDILDKVIKKLEDDKSEILFTALNNGDIKTQFGTPEKYINFIKTNTILDFDSINHIISLPGIIKPTGMNIVVFKKVSVVIKKTLQKEKIRDDFVITCQNPEETDNLKDPNKETLFVIRENKNFYPIVLVTKKDEAARNVKIDKIFKYVEKGESIVNHIMDFYNRNCQVDLLKGIDQDGNIPNAKSIYKLLVDMNDKEFYPKQQVIDARNKCKYIITQNSTIIPVKPSGSVYNLSILKNFEPKILDLTTTLSNMNKLYNKSQKTIQIKPIGLYYSSKTDSNAKIVGVMTKTYDVVPVKEETLSITAINKLGLVMENKQLYDTIDEDIAKGRDNYVVDERILAVNKKAYHEEAYELFRLEFSEYINRPQNEQILKKLMKLSTDKKMDKRAKRHAIRKILYRLIDKNLLRLYESNETKGQYEQKGGSYDKFIHIVNKLPKLDDYTVKNNRDTCETNKNKDVCSNNKHCYWTYDNCYLSMTKEMAIEFVNKMSEELAMNELKASEIYKQGDYFVSDIVDYNRFTEKDGQKIVKSTNYAINKVLGEMFGSENVPKIGKRRIMKGVDVDFQQLNVDNPLQDMGEYLSQRIIENNISILRAYANGYFWNKLKYYDLESRNLGYYSILQTNLSNYFRSLIIDWLTDKKHEKIINDQLINYFDMKADKNMLNEFIIKMTRDVVNSTNGVIEYFILNKLHNIPIIIYDDNNNIHYIIDDGIKFDYKKNKKEELSKYKNKDMANYIHIKFILFGGSSIPTNIDVLYYK